MEKRIAIKLDEYINNLKSDIITIIDKQCHDNIKIIIKNHIDNIPNLELSKEDFSKRRRIKNIVPFYERCCGLRANGLQCSRRRKNGSTFCGTHIKGQPHGVVSENSMNTKSKTKTISVKQQDIKGIIYYIDGNRNVYDPNDIINGIKNPKIIAKYSYDDNNDVYTIPEFGI